MSYGVMLALLGAAQLGLGLRLGPLSWLFAWSGLSWILAGCGYAFLGPKAFGKQADGRMRVWAVGLLLPFLAATWLLWHLQIALTREPRHVEVAPGIWLGRRCYAQELPPGVRTIVDLTSEFPETQAVRAGRAYHCLPTLDASTPSLQAFDALIATIVQSERPVYIHCALGHGRSAMTAIAAIAAQDAASTLAEVEQRVQQARPGVALSAGQRAFLQEWQAARTAPPER